MIQQDTLFDAYTTWYWENSESYRLGTNTNGTFTPSDIFTWGDMPRDEFR